MMAPIRILYKTILLILLLIIGAILALLFLRNTMPTHGPAATMTRLWHRSSLLILGIKIHVHGNRQDGNVLFVPNHISWLDISILGALIPTHFLSKAEILYWPMIGMLASRTGTLYIKRGSKNASAESNEVMQHALEQQHNIVLFAEGTTTDGSMRKFHGRLMQSAIDADGLIQPVALFYPDESGHAINRKVLYIDEMHFLKSVFTILATPNIPAEVHFLEPIEAKGKSRDELARYCHDSIYKIIKRERVN